MRIRENFKFGKNLNKELRHVTQRSTEVPAAPGKIFLCVSFEEVEVFIQSNKNTKRTKFNVVCGTCFVYLYVTVLPTKKKDLR